MRVVEGGEITDRIPTERGCFACMLGGADRRTLYLVTGDLTGDEATLLEQRPGRIESVRVEVPGAGWP